MRLASCNLADANTQNFLRAVFYYIQHFRKYLREANTEEIDLLIVHEIEDPVKKMACTNTTT